MRLHVDDEGPRTLERPPLVLLHGLLGSATDWAVQRQRHASERRIISLSLPGHDGSAAPAPGLTLDALADDVAALLASLEVSRAVIAGHSLGGMVALRVAARHPSLVHRLCLVSSVATAEPEPAKERFRRTLLLADTLGERPVLRALANVVFGSSCRRESVRTLEAWLENANRLSLSALRPLIDAGLERPDATYLLRHLSCPTLLIVGGEDQVTPAAQVRALSKHLPRATFTLIENAGHHPLLERPAAVSALLVPFLEES